jgi:hypothetical protein
VTHSPTVAGQAVEQQSVSLSNQHCTFLPSVARFCRSLSA